MRHCALFLGSSLLCLSTVVVACSDSASSTSPPADAGSTIDPDAGSGADTGTSTTDAGADGATDAAAPYVEPTNCTLRDDTGGPGQYSDGCVKREWVAPYAGSYTSAKCQLTISITGSVAATFSMKVLSGPLAGDYTTDFDGLPSPGNDSYYRFTTDTTFATTKTLNFNSGQKVGTSDERALALRVEDLDVGAGVFKGRYMQVIGGADEEVDCETMTKN